GRRRDRRRPLADGAGPPRIERKPIDMRIDLQSGLRPLQKVMARVMKLVAARMPPPVLVVSYRTDPFAKQISACFQEALPHCTEWSIGEAELFAAFVSNVNNCVY